MPKSFIHETAVVGMGFRYLLGFVESVDPNKQGSVNLPNEIYIGPFSIIGTNAKIGERVIVDAYCKIDSGAIIGNDTLVTYRATIASDAVVGSHCVIGGNVSEGTKVGNRCRSFGKLIHKHLDSTMDWDHREETEAAVTVHDDSFIGHDATVIGGIEIGPNSYVCSGALITKTVPPFHIAYGINQIVHYSEWKGELANNPIFREAK